jgi:hypothetical protein
MARAKPSSKRGNAVLHAQTIALSLHSWRPNTASDWQALEGVVTQLGAAAPRAAKAALESRKRSMALLANPFNS